MPPMSHHLLLRTSLLLALLACMLLIPAHSRAQTGGMITGVITDSSGAPIRSVETTLYVWHVPSGSTTGRWASVDTDNSNSDGVYELVTPFAGDFRVGFGTEMPFAGEFYNDAPTVESAQSIPVAAGEVVANINVQLAHYGKISGTVTEPGGLPLADVRIYARTMPRFTRYDSSTTTDATGYYEVYIAEGFDYSVRFTHDTYNHEFYDDQPSQENATAITVPLGGLVPNIDAELEPAPVVSGVVTDNSGAILAGITVEVRRFDNLINGNWEDWFIATLQTDEQGRYSIQLPAGEYKFLFIDPSENRHTLDYPRGGGRFLLAPDADITIDAQLTIIPTIRGRVTNYRTGQPIYVDIQVLEQVEVEGQLEWRCCAYQSRATHLTDGYYRVPFMEPGEYKILFVTDPFLPDVDEYYPNQRTLEDAAILTITPHSILTDIDAVIDFPGQMVGTVVNEAGQPLPGMAVIIHWPETLSGAHQWPVLRYTDENGQFTDFLMTDIPRYLVISDPSAQYAEEWFDDQPNMVDAVGITSTLNTTRTLQIQLGPSGSITGRVTTPAGEPLHNVLVSLYTYWPQHRSPLRHVGNSTHTDENGNYRFDSLTPGTNYRVRYQYQGYNYIYPNPEPVVDPSDPSNGDDVVIPESLLLADLNMALHVPDADGDGVPDNRDAFPQDPTEHMDSDEDGIGDNSDNCSTVGNPGQADSDANGIGDACDEPFVRFSYIFVSMNSNGTVSNGVGGNIAYRDEDILQWSPETQTWAMLFDGSDVGLGNVDVDAFFIYNGMILLSVDTDFTLPNLGAVDDSDIIVFLPTSIGNNTTGSYAFYFDGSDVGLSTTGEDIDAVGFDHMGRLVISVNGSLSVPRYPFGTVTGSDEDLIVLSNGAFGSNTQGRWNVYFDGSDVGLTAAGEDVQALWTNHAEGRLYLSTFDDYAVLGISGNEDDIILCTYITLGMNTSCAYSHFWDGQQYGMTGGAIDGIQVITPQFTQAAAAQSSNGEVDALALIQALTSSGVPILPDSEPWVGAPGDDSIESPGDDLDQPDELDTAETTEVEDTEEDVDQGNHHLFVPSINR